MIKLGKKRTSDLFHRKSYYFVIIWPNHMRSSMNCGEIIIFPISLSQSYILIDSGVRTLRVIHTESVVIFVGHLVHMISGAKGGLSLIYTTKAMLKYEIRTKNNIIWEDQKMSRQNVAEMMKIAWEIRQLWQFEFPYFRETFLYQSLGILIWMRWCCNTATIFYIFH